VQLPGGNCRALPRYLDFVHWCHPQPVASSSRLKTRSVMDEVARLSGSFRALNCLLVAHFSRTAYETLSNSCAVPENGRLLKCQSQSLPTSRLPITGFGADLKVLNTSAQITARHLPSGFVSSWLNFHIDTCVACSCSPSFWVCATQMTVRVQSLTEFASHEQEVLLGRNLSDRMPARTPTMRSDFQINRLISRGLR